jgi:O-antigen ligase
MIKNRDYQFWHRVFYSFGILLIVSIWITIYTENYLFLIIPAAILFTYLSVNDFRFIYFLLICCLPLSIEHQFPSGFSTDIPSEPLMVCLMFLFFAYVLTKVDQLPKDFFFHTIIIFTIIHLIWAYLATIYSQNSFTSIKFSLAKTWYIITFVFVTGILIKNEKHFRTFFWCLFIPLLFTVVYTLIRHSRSDFSFETVNYQMLPFFRNHVSYAVMMGLVVPFNVLAISWYPRKSFKQRFLIFSLIIILIAVYFAYTRAIWIALAAAVIIIPIIKKGWLKYFLYTGFAAILIFVFYMGYHNNYLDYAPNYEQTIYHSDLDEHLKSTFEGKDVSSAERIYRWIAGSKMWMQHPLVGYGPGNFYNFYKEFTVTSFTTYVSDNPEKSSVHNYFLLILVEQGMTGLMIFTILLFVVLTRGQKIYLQTESKAEKNYVMALLVCIIILVINLMLNDLIEADKTGSIYFICIALLVNQDIENRNLLQRNYNDVMRKNALS